MQTGSEASVDRLMKQISSFMSEISDDFKIVVIDAIRSLCLKFPSKQHLMLTFLAGVLRDEVGTGFRRGTKGGGLSWLRSGTFEDAIRCSDVWLRRRVAGSMFIALPQRLPRSLRDTIVCRFDMISWQCLACSRR
jgi:hypothetical protein